MTNVTPSLATRISLPTAASPMFVLPQTVSGDTREPDRSSFVTRHWVIRRRTSPIRVTGTASRDIRQDPLILQCWSRL
jgi:hypothetical protein